MDAAKTGGLIARKRRELGLSQAELAARLHVTDKAVSRWETGRGTPSVDLLEPLAAALGLTVSELLSGRELTAEERPREAETQLVAGLRETGRVLWKGVLRTVLTLIVIAGICAGVYLGYHYSTSVRVTDPADLKRAAERQWAECRALNVQQRGNYAAVLLEQNDGNLRLCVYERDDVFSERWRGGWGKQNVHTGELASWNYGSPQNEAVIVICGTDLPEEAVSYIFQNNGKTTICPVEEVVLDLFVLPGGRSDISATPILLNKDGEAVDERWEPWLENMWIFG